MQDEDGNVFVIEQTSKDFVEVKSAEYIGLRALALRHRALVYTPSSQTGMKMACFVAVLHRLFAVFRLCSL